MLADQEGGLVIVHVLQTGGQVGDDLRRIVKVQLFLLTTGRQGKIKYYVLHEWNVANTIEIESATFQRNSKKKAATELLLTRP